MTKKLSFTAICMALSVVCLFGASVAPSGRIALITVASLFCAVVVSECGARFGALHFLGVVVLASLLTPNRVYALSYAVFFGYYPLLKLQIERVRNLAAEWGIKLVCFAAIVLALYALVKTVLFPYVSTAIPEWFFPRFGWIAPVAVAALAVYDFALSLAMTYYRQRLRRHLKWLHS